jgi:hypothetical protein
MTHGFAFWNWLDYPYSATAGCEPDALRTIAIPLAAGVSVFLASVLLVRRFGNQAPVPTNATFLRWTVTGLVFAALAYTPFALLEGNSLLRTQLISAMPASFVIAAVLMWLDSLARARGWLLMGLSTLVVGCGLCSGLLQQLGLNHDWAGYRQVMRAILEAYPCVKDDTMIVVVRMPARISYSACADDAPFDPFRDVMWFNSGLQVMYPGRKVVGIYYRNDGSGSDSIRFKFTPDGAALDHAGIGLAGDHFDYGHIVAFRFDEKQGAVLLDAFPEDAVVGSVASEAYRPRERSACAVAPSVVRHRFE